MLLQLLLSRAYFAVLCNPRSSRRFDNMDSTNVRQAKVSRITIVINGNGNDDICR